MTISNHPYKNTKDITSHLSEKYYKKYIELRDEIIRRGEMFEDYRKKYPLPPPKEHNSSCDSDKGYRDLGDPEEEIFEQEQRKFMESQECPLEIKEKIEEQIVAAKSGRYGEAFLGITGWLGGWWLGGWTIYLLARNFETETGVSQFSLENITLKEAALAFGASLLWGYIACGATLGGAFGGKKFGRYIGKKFYNNSKSREH